MHPTPPDFMVQREEPQEVEDNKPDSRSEALTNEGALKKEHDSEFYTDGEEDKNRSSSDNMETENMESTETGDSNKE